MADLLAWLILMFSGWFDDCPCHGRSVSDGDVSRREQRQYYKRLMKHPCAMSCRRAPEMAGHFFFNKIACRLLPLLLFPSNMQEDLLFPEEEEDL